MVPDRFESPAADGGTFEMQRTRALSELSALHATGALSAEEFARARARLPLQPGYPRGRRTGIAGAVLAGIGGLLVLLAFMTFPLLELPFPFGSVSGTDLAGLTSQEPRFALLWLIPLVAAATVVVAALHLIAPLTHRGRPAALVVLGAAILLTYLVALVTSQNEINGLGLGLLDLDMLDLVGAGFWLAVIGSAATVVGGAAGLDRAPSLVTLVAAVVVVATTAFLVLVPENIGDDAVATSGSGSTPTTIPSSGPDPTSSAAPFPTTASTATSAPDSLDRIVAADRAGAQALLGSWIPQLSAKREGLEADGIVYAVDDVVANHNALVYQFPGALLVASDEYPSFREGGFYVTVVPTAFGTGEEALSWCVAQALGPDDCLAKRLLTTGSSEGNSLYQR